MRTIRPQTARQFFALATQHMRWQLNDMARRFDEQPPATALPEEEVAAPPSTTGFGLIRDARRILGTIEGLPEVEREMFDFIRIQGLTHAEAAEVVGISVKAVQRRLNRARLLLAEQLRVCRRTAVIGRSPDLPASVGRRTQNRRRCVRTSWPASAHYGANSLEDAQLSATVSAGELKEFATEFWSLTERGALDCRTNRFREAVPLFERNLRAESKPRAAVLNWLWLRWPITTWARESRPATGWTRLVRGWAR